MLRLNAFTLLGTVALLASACAMGPTEPGGEIGAVGYVDSAPLGEGCTWVENQMGDEEGTGRIVCDEPPSPATAY